MNVDFFPHFNACLNGLAGIFLLLGGNAIKKGDRQKHKKWMIAAFICSVFFLISYLTYHTLKPGVTRYEGTGIVRGIYFFILLTHSPLAVIIVPFSILAVVFGVQKKFEAHKRITRWLLPVWLYVSITGVLIYLMLYVL